MKTIKKIYLVSALALTAAVPTMMRADAVTDTKIHKAVEVRLTKAPTSANDLKAALDVLKVELLAIIDAAPNPAEYTTLKTALKQLDTKVLLAAIVHLKTVLNNVPGNTKALVLSNVPMYLIPLLK